MNLSPKQFFMNYRNLIIIITLIVAIGAYLFAILTPVKYRADFSLQIFNTNRQETTEYQYDNFYSIQAAEQLTKTVKAWLANPQIISQAYQSAGLEIDKNQLPKAIKGISAKQLSPHDLSVSVKAQSENDGLALGNSIINEVSNQLKQSEKTAKNQPAFELLASSPFVFAKKYNPYLLSLIGLITGFLLAIGLSSLKEFFKDK